MRTDKILTEPKCTITANNHVIGSFRGSNPGPTLIIVGSTHGNEPAGIIAARQVVSRLEKLCHLLLRGEVVFLSGNTRARARGLRYIDSDLNRHWTDRNLPANQPGVRRAPACSEDLEQRELLDVLGPVLARAQGEIYFLDLHTTSADGVPFATVGDTLRNREFALCFPVTIMLGIEEQLDGTLLEYVNNLGAITMGFEAGQHTCRSSIEHAEAIIWIALAATRCLRREDMPELDRYRARLERASGGARIVEIRYRHPVMPDDGFEMEPGFVNFQTVRRGQLLAREYRGPVRARETGLIIMPRYQALGDDGFFLGREVRPFWLKVSKALRRLNIGDYVHLLPGVERHGEKSDTLIVNTRIARLFPLQIFHLLGFRKRRWNNNYLEVSRRRYDRAGPVRPIF